MFGTIACVKATMQRFKDGQNSKKATLRNSELTERSNALTLAEVKEHSTTVHVDGAEEARTKNSMKVMLGNPQLKEASSALS